MNSERQMNSLDSNIRGKTMKMKKEFACLALSLLSSSLSSFNRRIYADDR